MKHQYINWQKGDNFPDISGIYINLMDNRTRIINTVLMKEIDRQPFKFYFGPWGETVARWESEGLPKGTPWHAGFNFDPGIRAVNVNLGYYPAFERKVIEEREHTRIVQNHLGLLEEVLKSGSSPPRTVSSPVTDRKSWLKLRDEKLNPDSPERFPANWENLVKEYSESECLIQIGWFPYGLFGTLRDMMGPEPLLYAFYEDPELIHEIMDYLTDFWLKIYEKVAEKVELHVVHMWEDMSGKNGSLISPKMVSEFMVPNYKKFDAFAKKHNIPIFSLDTDGNCSQLLPLFLESGINLVLPFEVAAGSDIVEYRKQYPTLCMNGGIDKREIAKGPEAIDRELDRIDSMFKGPGYWASVDHLIHPEISWENFKYFVTEMRKRIEKYRNTEIE